MPPNLTESFVTRQLTNFFQDIANGSAQQPRMGRGEFNIQLRDCRAHEPDSAAMPKEVISIKFIVGPASFVSICEPSILSNDPKEVLQA